MANQYTEFHFDPSGNLIIKLLPEEREEIERQRSLQNDDKTIFADLVKLYTANGWQYVRPDEIGAAVSEDCIILTKERVGDDAGNLVSVGPVYAYSVRIRCVAR
ncbi:MAG: hypothetical protein DYG89_44120 [Caldilinea sp. CFX5]|nr:hypothetical protein [Caldilinea sp. CFX5]